MSQHITTTRKLVFSSNQTIPERFKAIAAAFPDEPALFFQDRTLTFAELDRLSDQLAQALLRLGVQTGDFVAICLDRSPEMMVAIFAILKAGGAYVPIDVDYPADRRRFLIKDANAKVILTQQYLKKRLPDTDAPVIALDADWWRIDRQFDPAKPTQNPVKPPQPAYMIYTSGSTGKPKGVLISHENLMNQLEGQQDIAPAPIGRMILTCSISFDVSVLTIFWALLQGAPLVLPGQGEEKDMEILSGLIARHGVTHLLTLPSLHTLLLDQAPPGRLQSLRLVNVSGEVCPTSLAQKHEKLLPNTQLYNLYGPTEATVNCTFFTIPKGFNAPKVPIGKPILNYELFILDEKMREVAPGEVGEIYIGGSKPVVGLGYWNREKLTRERFIANPFRKIRGGSVLYKTGDLGRWLPDGNIEFLGRSDFQVKFKGYRIELGEIETAIAQHLGVRETVVVLKGEPGSERQKLVAYIVPGSGFELNVNELREFLSVTLPDYMMPTTFVFLEKMPLTTNGKINRAALPDPDHQRPELAQDFEAPETELEVLLSELWANLLGVSPIGRHDKFFELGGTSILAARFIGELQKRMQSSVFITTLFDHPTIATYAAFLEAHYADKLPALTGTTPKPEKPPIAILSKSEMAKIQTARPPVAELTEPQTIPAKTADDRLQPSDIQVFHNIIPRLLPTIGPTKKTPKNPPAVFILAPPRSGTTLLRVMLAGHPKLFAVNELQLLGFNDMRERAQAYTGKFSLWKEGLIRAIMEIEGLTADAARAQIEQYEIAGMATKAVFAHLQNKVHPRILVDKSPSYVLDPAALEKAETDFENPVYIHLVRHPYSMVRSFVKYHMDQVLYLHPHNYSARQLGELVWLESHKNTALFLEKVPRHRHIRVLYEDLVTQPAKIMWEICRK